MEKPAILSAAVLACVLAGPAWTQSARHASQERPQVQPPPVQSIPSRRTTPDWPAEPPVESASSVITGRERLAWDQQAPHMDELRRYEFVLYVDGAAFPLAEASCGPLDVESRTAACSSPLPPLEPGRRVVQLATRLTRNGATVESVKSARLILFVSGASAASRYVVGEGGAIPTSGDARFVVDAVAAGLDRPSALARLPDGRLLVGEGGGRIRIAESGVLRQEPAAVLHDADAGGNGRMSLAVARDFENSRHVYVGYIGASAQGGRSGRVVRFREVAGALGEPAVIVDSLPADAGAPVVKVGPDGLLYVATPALDARAAGDLGSYAGKLLRFNTDGTTPEGNPLRQSPTLSSGHAGQFDFDWEPDGQTLWTIESDPEGVAIRRVGRAMREDGGSHVAGTAAVRLGGVTAGAAAFHAAAVPDGWQGSLFFTAPDEECIVRIAGLAESSPRAPVIERLLHGRLGRPTAVLSADDGLYVAALVDEGGVRGAPTGSVYRLRDR